MEADQGTFINSHLLNFIRLCPMRRLVVASCRSSKLGRWVRTRSPVFATCTANKLFKATFMSATTLLQQKRRWDCLTLVCLRHPSTKWIVTRMLFLLRKLSSSCWREQRSSWIEVIDFNILAINFSVRKTNPLIAATRFFIDKTRSATKKHDLSKDAVGVIEMFTNIKQGNSNWTADLVRTFFCNMMHNFCLLALILTWKRAIDLHSISCTRTLLSALRRARRRQLPLRAPLSDILASAYAPARDQAQAQVQTQT